MNLKTVTKRSGSTVRYNRTKIFNAISGANRDASTPHDRLSDNDLELVTSAVENAIADSDSIGVEEIQDVVEKSLMQHGFFDVAKQFIVYREKHARRREAQKNLMEVYRDIFFANSEDVDFKRDNANINANASMGVMLKLGTEGAKFFVDNYVLPERFVDADRDNFIHIHDKDFSLITFNCCQIDLLKLFHGGFSTGHGFLREPNSIRSYASLACIAIQSNQNDMFGGQSINAFDYAMAEGVRKSFVKAIRAEIERAAFYFDQQFDPSAVDFNRCRYSEKNNPAAVDEINKIVGDKILAEKIYRQACREVEEETHQAMEALIHNFNTLHSRAGAQVPFSSINYGMDTSPEGRLVIREVLNAIDAGLGNSETPIFPISVFQLKADVNYNPSDPNYDLFIQACRVSAKRLFPNFVNIDAPYNLQYYKPGDYNSCIATMGCRTRVMANLNGPEQSGSRGNFAFVTINLPKLALEADGKLEKFFELFDHYIELSHDYILHRLKTIEKKHFYNYPFLMEQHVWLDSEKFSSDDTIAEVLKHASYSIGFCGLAECLVVLTGKHHGQSEESQRIGLQIVGHLRHRTDEFAKLERRNWTTFATPAESTAGSFQRANREKFGVIEGVTDREYMTNSSHVPVYFPIKALDKIKIEAPYHALCNAGHIAYIEMNADASRNVKAFEKLVRAMHDADMGYFSINHPVDRDPVCGFTGIIANECPHCKRKEKIKGSFHINRLQ